MSELARVEAKPFAFLGVWYSGMVVWYHTIPQTSGGEAVPQDIIIVSFRCRPRENFCEHVHHTILICVRDRVR